ncbi:hypothetical protein D3C78_1404990 [compost metagenome]
MVVGLAGYLFQCADGNPGVPKLPAMGGFQRVKEGPNGCIACGERELRRRGCLVDWLCQEGPEVNRDVELPDLSLRGEHKLRQRGRAALDGLGIEFDVDGTHHTRIPEAVQASEETPGIQIF